MFNKSHLQPLVHHRPNTKEETLAKWTKFTEEKTAWTAWTAVFHHRHIPESVNSHPQAATGL